MVGAKVLFNSPKMLKMGILVVFMHDYGHYVSLRESVTFFIASHCLGDAIRGVLMGPECYFTGCFSEIADFLSG